jgi:hypothetical protein
MFKKIIIFMTSLLLIINSTLANAATIGAWTLSNPMAVGASMLYDGSKGAATSSVLITPNASQVAKVLRGGAAGLALSYAVEQLLGAVDWVLDPANNQIKYKGFDCTSVSQNTNCPYFINNFVQYGTFSSIEEAAKYYFYDDLELQEGSMECRKIASEHSYWNCILSNPKNKYGYQLSYSQISIRSASLLFQPVEKTLPLETVAQKVIENAESDNLDAQFAVLAAANNILSEAEQDDAKAKPIEDELENNAKCPSGIVRNGSCWICDKSQFMPITRATRDAKTATRGKSCKNVTDTAIKTANATLFRNLINARIQENACWSPPDPNHATALLDAQNALSLCEN